MAARPRTSKPKPAGRPSPPKTPAPTPEAHGMNCDPTSEACSRQKQLWNWFLESLGQEKRSPPPTPTRSTPPVEVMQKELLSDLLRKCAEYEKTETEREHKENYETWKNFTRAAVDRAWDEAQKRNAATDCAEKDLSEEEKEEKEEEEEEGTVSPVFDEAPPVLIGLPSDEEASSDGSEKKRRDHVYRQERRERVRRWVKEQRELVMKQREAKRHAPVPKQVARSWLDQLRLQAWRDRCHALTRAPGAAVSATGEQRRYPWDEYLREKNTTLMTTKSDKIRRDSHRETK